MTIDADNSKLYFHWIKRDAVRFPTFKFKEAARIGIIEAMPNLLPNEQQRVIAALEGCISNYKAWRIFENKNATGRETHKRVDKLIKKITQLNEAMLALDWGTRRAIAPYLMGKKKPSLPALSFQKPPELEALDQAACLADNILQGLLTASENYLNYSRMKAVGRKKLYARVDFIVSIAQSLHKHATGKIKISSTANSQFENIVRVCLAAAGFEITSDLHRIVLDGTKAYRKILRNFKVQ